MKSKIIVGTLILFICVCAFLGGRLRLYDTVWWWDVMLHTVSGAAFAIIGFMLAGRLCKNNVSILFAALFAFTFAVTAGVVWEIVEFAVDSIRYRNMQRWMFMPVPNNAEWLDLTIALRGSGLIDTMKDLIAGTISALITAVIGYCWLRKKDGKSK